MNDTLRGLWEAVKASLIILLATETKLVVLAMALFLLDIVGGSFLVNGRLNKNPLKHIKNCLLWLVRWGFLVLVMTLFANGFDITKWIVDATYIAVCGQLLRRNFKNVTAAESDVQRFFDKLWGELRRRNVDMLETEQDPNSNIPNP